jgi:putative ABC transport system permease protein
MLFDRLRYDLRTLFQRSKLDDDLRDELAYHLEQEKKRFIAEGLDPDEAARLASIALGGVMRTREESRDVSGFSWLDSVSSDFRYGVRSLLGQRLFGGAVVTTLGLGIGVTATIFAIVNAVVFRDLPFPAPDRLVAVWETDMTSTQVGADRGIIAPANLVDWRNRSRTFAGFASYVAGPSELGVSADIEEVIEASGSADLMAVVGMTPLVGRGFRLSDGDVSAERVTVLGEPLWRRRFGGDPQLLGRSIRIDGIAHRVVGVIPAGHGYPREAELWTVNRPDPLQRSAHFLNVIGRLKPEVTIAAAQADLSTIAAQLERQYPVTNKALGVRVIGLQDDQNRAIDDPLLLLFGAVGCVLLIACANVGGLFLARSATRETELALRSSLGASRVRILQQLFTEAFLLAAAGTVLGLTLAAWAIRVAIAISPVALVPAAGTIGVDRGVFVLGLLLSILMAAAFTAVAAGARAGSLADGLRAGGRQTLQRPAAARGRRVLVVAEVALTMLLLCGAGLMLRTLTELQQVDLGFAPQNLSTTSVQLPGIRYPAATGHADQVIARMITNLRADEKVQAAAAVFMLPFGGDNRIYSFRKTEAPDKAEHANFRVATAGYFSTMQVPLLRGRDFGPADTVGAPLVVIINATMAHRFWPGENVLGHRISVRGGPPSEIIGVAGDVKYFSHDSPAEPEMYAAHTQLRVNGMTLVIRATGDLQELAATFANAIHGVDPALPLRPVKPMSDLLGASLAVRRFARLLLGGFAALGLVLSCVGLYGLVAYSVSQRTNELGIRIALGARPTDIIRLLGVEGVAIAVAGTLIGLGGALMLGRVLSRLLFGVHPSDLSVLLVAAAVLACVALAASLIPALRATRLSPSSALRHV